MVKLKNKIDNVKKEIRLIQLEATKYKIGIFGCNPTI